MQVRPYENALTSVIPDSGMGKAIIDTSTLQRHTERV